MTFDQRAGKKIRKARQELGLTDKQAAKLVGTSLWRYKRVEIGEAMLTIDFLENICKGLKIDGSIFFN